MTSMFLSAAAAATGCPENVRVWFSCRFWLLGPPANASAICSVAMAAPIGR